MHRARLMPIFLKKDFKKRTGNSFRVFEFQQRKEKRTVILRLKTAKIEGSVNSVHVNVIQQWKIGEMKEISRN